MQNRPSPQNQFPSALDQAMQRWMAGSKDSRPIQWAFLGIISIYMVCLAVAGTGPVNIFGHDELILLDGGWRILNGQIPHRDFYLALGPLEYMLTAAGLWLTHLSPRGIEIGSLLLAAVVGVWGWMLARTRMHVIPALIATGWLIGTATSPTPIGLLPNLISCAMIYNRHGYALLGLILLECAFTEERNRFVGGVSSGIALGLLVFLKLNFFGAALLLLLVTVPLRRMELRRLGGVLLGFAGVAAAFTIYLRFSILAFLSDMHFAVVARGSSLSLRGLVGDFPMSEEGVTLAIMTVLAVLLAVHGRLWQRSSIRTILLGAMVIFTGVLLRRTDTAETGFQLTTLWITILIERLTAAYPNAKEKTAISVIIALGLGSIAAQIALNVESVGGMMRYQTPAMRSSGFSIDGPGLEGLKFYDYDDQQSIARFDNGHQYVDSLNDGSSLLRRWSSPEESVATLGFQNPFPYILKRKPALGGSPWFQVGNNITYQHMLPAERFFGTAQLVMVPACNSHMEREAGLASNYHSYLMDHFALVTKSPCWTMYRRKPATP